MPTPPKKLKKIIITKRWKKGMMPPGRGLLGQALLAIVIFLFLMSIYSLVSNSSKKAEEISLSEVAQEISLGSVSSITVVGDKLTITYLDGAEKISKKEAGTALTTTFKNYDISPEALSKVKMEVRNDQGFAYWFFSLAPIILPIAFIVFFLLFLSRQVKGAGMQAFSFGQSKARLTSPDDKVQRITFKDVAGCKEAK